MTIVVREPLELLPYKAGSLGVTKEEKEAEAAQQLDSRQRPLIIGETIPIVFCRRLNNSGGVWISPGASEGRFENDSSNKLTVYYQLVLSEGQLPNIPLRDLYQGPCAIGVYLQNYNARAGAWLPGNFVTSVSALVDLVQFTFDTPFDPNANWYNATKNQYGGWDFIYNGVQHYYPGGPVGPAGSVTSSRLVTEDTFVTQKTPLHCGTSGIYTNLTTLSFSWQFPNGNDKWDRQVHAFIRNGMQVTRILDSTLGPSNNVIDLALYLINQSSRLPSTLIDTTAMTLAANFTNTNSFFYNGEFKESSNLDDWMQDIAPKFLLRLSDKNGKKGFRPVLPINNDYTIKTTAVSWVFTFTEDHILPDGFDIQYISLADRKPVCALMVWRYQPENDIGVIRTVEVRFAGEAPSGPFEQYDLSQFCTNENHAVKVGAYYVARRKYVTHSLRLRVKPDTYGGTLALGDLVRVRLSRETEPEVITYHDFLYEVETITKDISGVVELELMHFPIDSQNRSLVALAVNAATGPGYVLPTSRTDFSCSLNTSTTPIATSGDNLPDLPDQQDYEASIPESAPTPEESNGSNTYGRGEAPPDGLIDNTEYPAATGQITGGSGPDDQPIVGDTLSASGVCPGAYIAWYRCPKSANVGLDPTAAELQCEQVLAGSEEFDYTVTNADIDYEIVGVGKCPDPSTPNGLGDAFVIGKSEPVEPDVSQYSYARLVGTITIFDYTNSPNPAPTVVSFTTPWFNYGPSTPALNGLWLGGVVSGDPSVTCNSTPLEVSLCGSPDTQNPWRSSVSAQGLRGSSPAIHYIGGIAPYKPSFGDTSRTNFGWYERVNITVEGVWEFSNNQSTVLETWDGRPDTYEYPFPAP